MAQSAIKELSDLSILPNRNSYSRNKQHFKIVRRLSLLFCSEDDRDHYSDYHNSLIAV